MSSPTDPARGGSASSDPAGLRQDIEQTREELADTVSALAHRVDVKGRAQDKAQELKAQAMEKARQVRVQAPEKAQQWAGVAQQKARQVGQDNPGAVVGAALAVLMVLILRRRRRRRRGRR